MNIMHGEKMTEAGGAKVVCFTLNLKVSMVGNELISRNVAFQMTGAAERKE